MKILFKISFLAVLLSFVWAPAASAVTKEINLVFFGNTGKLVNATPTDVGSNCGSEVDHCIRLPVNFSGGPIAADHDVRQGPMFSAPTMWKTVELINVENNEVTSIDVKISGVGVRQRFKQSVADLVPGSSGMEDAHYKLWYGGSWLYPQAPCVIGRYPGGDYTSYDGFWKMPVPGTCFKRARYPIPELSYDHFDIGYELRLPKAKMMFNGTYTGRISYTLGPHQDFDMGDIMLPSDSQITFEFTLRVEHELKVDIDLPPGGNRIELLPRGGWQRWLQTQRVPKEIERTQPFHFSTTGPFRVTVFCDFGNASRCSIRRPGDNSGVSYMLVIELPSGFVDEHDRPITKTMLLPKTPLKIYNKHSVSRARGTLQFTLGEVQIKKLLENPGDTYSGRVTIVWDSDV